LLVACQSAEDLAVQNAEFIEQVENIESYLAANIGISAHGGEVFCAYEPLNTTQGKDGEIFLWAFCHEYYLEDGELEFGSGISVPVVLQIDERREILGHLLPRDGTYYGEDIRANFPRSTWSQIMPEGIDEIDAYNTRSDRLKQETEDMAADFYDN
jgi:hypothetical protein